MRELVVLAALLVSAGAAAAQPPALNLPPRYSMERVYGDPASVDGPVATAQVRGVTAMALAPDGSLYVADSGAIRRVLNGVVTTVAGSAGRSGTVDGPGVTARFSFIGGLAISSDGTVLIADTGNHTIRRMTPGGVVSTWLGVPGIRGLAHGRGAAARFDSPLGIAVDHTGVAYVVDRNCTLRRVTSEGDVQLMVTLSGTCYAAGSQPHKPRVYYGPVAVAVDANQQVYVAMQFNTVRQVTPSGVQTTLAGGDLGFLKSITVTPTGAVRVLESFIWDHRFSNNAQFFGQNAVREIAPDGTLTTVATLVPRTGGGGVGFSGLAVAADGAMFVGNNEATRIDRVAPDGTIAAWIGAADRTAVISLLAPGSDGSLMTAGWASRQLRRLGADGTLGPVLHTTTYSPTSIVRLGDDYYFTDNNTIGRMTSAGVVSVVTTFTTSNEHLRELAAAPDGTLVAWIYRSTSPSGWRLARVTTQGVVTTLGTGLGALQGIAVSPTTGAIYLSDDRVIRRLMPDGTTTIVAGNTTAPRATVDGSSADARLVYPTKLRVRADGTVVFLDGVGSDDNYWSNMVLREMRPSGDIVSLWSDQGGMNDLEISTTGALHLAISGSVYRAVSSTPAPLVITTQPSSVAVQAGTSATFSIVAAGGAPPVVLWQVSTDGGSTWTTLTDSPASGAVGSRLTLHNVSRAMHGYRYRAALADEDEFMVSAPVTLSVTGMSVSPSALRFSATRHTTTGVLVHVTPMQAVTIAFTTGAPPWTATTSVPWLQIHSEASAGAGRVRVSIVNPGGVIGAQTSLVGAVTITPTDPTLPAITVPVDLSVTASSQSTTAPVGQVDTPTHGATGLQGAIAMTGWVVDDIGIQHVRIYRQCLHSDAAEACQPVLSTRGVLVGDASVISGARPDVEALYPTLPAANSAGWGFLILSNMLPHIPAGLSNGGVGTFTLMTVATDTEGQQTLLGRTINDATPTSVTVANDTIAKPFGAIDTPGQGATVSGALNNFGWVLTPDPGTGALVPVNGSTIEVFIDGASVGTATYNLCRGTVGNPVPAGMLCDDDVSSIFRGAGTGYRNLDAGRGPIGLRTINTTGLSNGLHTIVWGVRDSAGRSEGIGSRYFNVLNSASDVSADLGTPELRNSGTSGRLDSGTPIFARTGFDLHAAFTPLESNADGVPQVRIPELGRVELQVPGATHVSLLANGDVRSAPVGMSVDEEAGMVRWSVGPGYLGTYRLRIEPRDLGTHLRQGSGGQASGLRFVDVTVAPMTLVEEPVRMHLDRADQHGAVFTLHGWGFDPHADTGSGIGAVHVWARRLVRGSTGSMVQGSESVFLGVADLGVSRPDVAAAHGARFSNAGFSFQGALGDGEWEITAFIWNTRTGRFEDARSVVVTIK